MTHPNPQIGAADVSPAIDPNRPNPCRCPSCGRPYIPPKRILNAIRLMKAGVGLSAAARAAGVSKQRLSQIKKSAKWMKHFDPPRPRIALKGANDDNG
jgi:hypothetical protein